MNLPFRPTPMPERVVITRQQLENVERALDLIEGARADVGRAILLLETGRTGKAVEVLRELAGRMA